MTDLEAIARGLSKAQREVIEWPLRKVDWREQYAFRLSGGAPHVNAVRALVRLGVAERQKKCWLSYYTEDFKWAFRLTPLGLTLRRHILAQEQQP